MALNGSGLTHHAKIGGMHIVHYTLGEHAQIGPLYVMQILHAGSFQSLEGYSLHAL